MVEAYSKEGRAGDLIKRKVLLDDPWYQLILKMMKSNAQSFQGKQMLEVGCGLGGFCILLAGKGANPIGLDISPNAINEAKALAKHCKLQNQIDFIIGDAQFLPFKDKSNDIIICSETLEHVANYEQVFCELVRVTEESGYLYLTVPNFLSTLLFEYIVLLSIGQPQYAKNFLSVEKEHVFHLFKIKKLVDRDDLEVIEIRSTDFFHLPPTIRKALKIDKYLKVLSNHLENHGSVLRLFGAHIGVVGKKK